MIAVPNNLNPLEKAIWRTVAYVDVFDYPLTAAEIHRYLDGYAALPGEVTGTLSGSRTLARQIRHCAGFYHLAGREKVVDIRRARQERAQHLWPQAMRYGRLIAQLPFVRLVAVTGSLAMNNVGEEADIDYFIVTENGRLWLARALTIGIVRLAARRGVALCPNYFVSASALTLPERNVYTAREIVQMVPLFGRAVYDKLRQRNCWVAQFLPNAEGPPPVPFLESEPARWLQALVELPLGTELGRRLELWEQRRKIIKLQNQQNGASESYFTPGICKGHFQAHQQRTLSAYHHRLASKFVNREP